MRQQISRVQIASTEGKLIRKLHAYKEGSHSERMLGGLPQGGKGELGEGNKDTGV